MEEFENQDVNAEVVTPQVEDVSHEQTAESQELSDKEINFRKMREANAQLQKEKEELFHLAKQNEERFDSLKSYVDEKLSSSQTQAEPEEEYEDEDWITKKFYEKRMRKDAETVFREMLESERKKEQEEAHKKYVAELPNKLNKEIPDFESVVTKENIEYLKANKPHIAATLGATTDLYHKAKSTYDAIKAFCPGVTQSEEVQRLEKNQHRPSTMGGGKGQNTLAEAKSYDKRMTPELKKLRQQEMLQAIRGG